MAHINICINISVQELDELDQLLEFGELIGACPDEEIPKILSDLGEDLDLNQLDSARREAELDMVEALASAEVRVQVALARFNLAKAHSKKVAARAEARAAEDALKDLPTLSGLKELEQQLQRLTQDIEEYRERLASPEAEVAFARLRLAEASLAEAKAEEAEAEEALQRAIQLIL